LAEEFEDLPSEVEAMVLPVSCFSLSGRKADKTVWGNCRDLGFKFGGNKNLGK
jgi:hypothetical protein